MKKCGTADKCSSFYLHPIKLLKCNKGPSQSCFLFPHVKMQINTSSAEAKLPGQSVQGIKNCRKCNFEHKRHKNFVLIEIKTGKIPLLFINCKN